jgi:hypothetical protein
VSASAHVSEPVRAIEPVRVLADEAEVVLAELASIEAAASLPARKAAFAALREALEAGSLGEEQVRTLEPVLELALQTGRIRAIHGPGGEQAALRLYRRLPSGAELRRSAQEVTEALTALQGRELESLSLDAVGPAAFSLSVNAGGMALTIRLDRQGARLASVAA